MTPLFFIHPDLPKTLRRYLLDDSADTSIGKCAPPDLLGSMEIHQYDPQAQLLTNSNNWIERFLCPSPAAMADRVVEMKDWRRKKEMLK